MNTGIHTMAAADYHADPCDTPSLSASIAHTLYERSPLHAWTEHPKLNPAFVADEQQKFDIGTATHAMLLEPGRKVIHEVEADSWRKKDAQEVRDLARAQSLVPLLSKDCRRVEHMVDAVRAQLDERDDNPPVFADGAAEQTLIWEETTKHGPVTCRARADWLRTDLASIDDLKTTGASAHPMAWSRRTFWDIGADMQACFYLLGLSRLNPKARSDFRFCVIENTPPYALSVITLGASTLELGRRKVEWAINRWAECVANDDWPAYSQQTAEVELDSWQEARFLERTWTPDTEDIAA